MFARSTDLLLSLSSRASFARFLSLISCIIHMCSLFSPADSTREATARSIHAYEPSAFKILFSREYSSVSPFLNFSYFSMFRGRSSGCVIFLQSRSFSCSFGHPIIFSNVGLTTEKFPNLFPAAMPTGIL